MDPQRVKRDNVEAMKQYLIKFVMLALLFANVSISYAVSFNKVSGSAYTPSASTMQSKDRTDKLPPCHEQGHMQGHDQVQKQANNCCETQACEHDCNSCQLLHSSAGIISSFETEIFIHIASQKHFTPLLFSSSALTNLYRPPRLN